MLPNEYKNIIFDLGGVILNIDYQRSVAAFRALGIADFENKYSQHLQIELFDSYERGEISSDEFRNGIRTFFNSNISNAEIDNAWNAMLLDLPVSRLRLLEKLSENKRIVLLSNTNEIHIEAFHHILDQGPGAHVFKTVFQHIYYSFEMGMRKPEPRIFRKVLTDQGFELGATIFIDDSAQHIEGARSIGLAAYHLNAVNGETINELF